MIALLALVPLAAFTAILWPIRKITADATRPAELADWMHR